MSSWAKTKNTLLEKINFKNKTILDVGCGSGWFSIWVSNNGAKEIYGIDPLRDQIENAKRNSKNKKMNFKLGFAEDLPFKDNKFDAWFTENSETLKKVRMKLNVFFNGNFKTLKITLVSLIEFAAQEPRHRSEIPSQGTFSTKKHILYHQCS